MSIVGYINISLEIWGSILSLIFIICIILSGNTKDKTRWPFMQMLGCNIIVLLSDAVAWGFKGKTDLFSRWIVPVSNFLVFVFGYVLLAVFTNYLVTYIATKKTQISRKPIYVVWSLCIVAIFCVIVSQINHMYYFIDETNFYHRQNWFWLSQLWGIFCMFINAAIIIKYRTSLNTREIIALASYIVLPILSMCIQIFVYGIALLYISTTVSILIIYFGIQAEQAKIMKEKELELTEERLRIMLSQIKPHFLFNALTAISQLCDIDHHKAKIALVEFSQYLRANLDSLTRKSQIPFEQELDHINIYLSLEKMRFDDKLKVAYDLQVTNFLVPPLTIQPIVENAVRYGIGKKENGGTIHICTSASEETIKIIISDDGIGFDSEITNQNGRTHIGIQNVTNRLQSQCGGSLAIKSIPGSGTTAIITLPRMDINS